MALANNILFFFFIYHLLLFKVDSKCPKSFDCGHLGALKFPLSNDPNCGLFVMKDCDSSAKLHLKDEGYWYKFIKNTSANQFVLSYPYPEKHTFCSSFDNLSLPKSPFFSFTLISPNITLFKCPPGKDIHDHFQSYQTVDCYDHLNMYYYKYPNTEESSVPSACSAIQLPINPSHDSDDFFELLTVEFTLQWNVSEACFKCHEEGGQCLTDKRNKLHCKKGNRPFKLVFVIGGFITILTFIISILFIWRKYNTLHRLFGFQRANTENEKDIEIFLKNYGNLAPIRYNYSNIKKMTKSFSENLGKGGYGSVYKGELPDGRLVAVKILNESKGNGEEFLNEVASISRTSHINIVTLLGFCFEGTKRALIYEFMPNGSLEKFIQNTASTKGGLGWQILLEIALGSARGLEYLHQGCNTRILHFDIKPHNILLDKDFNPKISDFGLARLCPNRSSIVSMLVARGTIGYIAPEVFCRNFGEVSHKSDVYSYGMLVLEIAGGKKAIDPKHVDHSSEKYFPHYIYKQLEMNAERGCILDGVMKEDESQFAKRKLIIVGLWCIQTDPKDRPSMTNVVEMLEGKLESLQVPPKPYLSSPPRPTQEFSISESV